MNVTSIVKDTFVIGGADRLAADRWCLNLEPYTELEADRAIAWQRQGQGQFDTPGYWAKTKWNPEARSFDRDGYCVALLADMSRDPYTEQAWAAFGERLPKSAAA